MMADVETVANIKKAVKDGNYRFGPHAYEHMWAEGFGEREVSEAVAGTLRIVEAYTDERVLVLGFYHLSKKTRMPLHMVCEFVTVDGVDFVTIYIPSKPDWFTPTQKGRKKR
jgi:hypothetical protein